VDTKVGLPMGDKLTRRMLDAWIKAGDNEGWLWCGEQRGFGAQRRGNGTAAFVVQFRVGRGRLAKRRRVVLGKAWVSRCGKIKKMDCCGVPCIVSLLGVSAVSFWASGLANP